MTEPATSSPPRHLTPPRDIRPPRLQFPRPLVRPAFPSPPNFAAFGDVGARQSCPAFCLWFAKMISDAKSLRISDIHINVRAWEDKACNISSHAVFLRPEEIFGRHNRRTRLMRIAPQVVLTSEQS